MNTIEVPNMCVDCKTPSFLLANLHLPIGDIASLFYTISPDVELNDYNNKLPDQQKRFIEHKFNVGVKDLQKHMKVYGYTMHYEFNKSNNLHVHGILYTPQYLSGYTKNCVIVSKIFHKLFGRPRVNSSVACRVEWVKDIAKVCEYVNKENIYPPLHKCLVIKDVTCYLAKGDSALRAPAKEESTDKTIEELIEEYHENPYYVKPLPDDLIVCLTMEAPKKESGERSGT